ncbi:MAG TPA: ABC transporter ATP-binding protein [Candidatus Dormibacteraeota bacterium]
MSARLQPDSAGLWVEGLSAGYGGPPIIRDVSIEVGRARVAAVIGPNGAGKSTLVKVVVGLLPPSSGAVWVGGRNVTALPCELRCRAGMGYVPQVDDVFPTMTVRENLEIGTYVLPRGDRSARLDQVCATFPILQGLLQRVGGKLSGGERKIVAMGRALVANPKILVLDEPTAGLAPELAARLLGESVRQLAASGITVLMVEQKARMALEVSDVAYVLVAGQVRISGPAREVLQRQDVGDLYLGKVGRVGIG